MFWLMFWLTSPKNSGGTCRMVTQRVTTAETMVEKNETQMNEIPKVNGYLGARQGRGHNVVSRPAPLSRLLSRLLARAAR